MRIYFVRHGESDANVLRVISNRNLPHGLTERGQQQVEDLAKVISRISFRQLFSSPVLRAVQTAEILSEKFQIGFELTEALREYDCGIIEGKANAESWALHRKVREDWIVRHQWESRVEGGESYIDMQNRFVPFIHRLLENGNAEENILLVGHGGLYMCMLPAVLSNVSLDVASTLPFPNTAYVMAETRPEGLVCLEWCGVPI